jgi:DNA repair protein RadD
LTTGVDWDVRCIVLARPTKSEMLFVQMVGRGLRKAEGKDHCLILDHSDNHSRLGFVTDIHHDTLDDGKAINRPKPKSVEKLPKKCPRCQFLKPPKTLQCPNCGLTPEPKCQVVAADGELVEWQNRNTSVGPTQADKVAFYRELRGYAAERAREGRPLRPGWVDVNFRDKFGNYPPNGFERYGAVSPGRVTLGWIKHKQIAYAKRRGAPA